MKYKKEIDFQIYDNHCIKNKNNNLISNSDKYLEKKDKTINNINNEIYGETPEPNIGNSIEEEKNQVEMEEKECISGKIYKKKSSKKSKKFIWCIISPIILLISILLCGYYEYNYCTDFINNLKSFNFTKTKIGIINLFENYKNKFKKNDTKNGNNSYNNSKDKENYINNYGLDINNKKDKENK